MSFSKNALNILCKRYFYKNNSIEQPVCDNCNETHETIDEFFERVSMGNKIYREQLLEPLRFLPNSPTLFNIGTPTGGTLSACFFFNVEDTLFDDVNGIAPVMMKAMKVLKAGGGTGYAFNVRPEGALVNSTHRGALGPLGVMRMYHRMALEITQGGKRDAAQMGILSCDHPDLEKFIHAKDIDPDALGTFNISVALTDRFMSNANSSVEHESNILKQMAKSAWTTGDPGVYFIDAANRDNPTPWLGRLLGTNPCGEVPLLPNEPCNLGSINLAKMLQKDVEDKYIIAYGLLRSTARLATRYLDDVLDVNVFPDPEVDHAARLTRKLGLGVCGWADVLTLMNIDYDSDEAVTLGEKVMKTINEAAELESFRLAEEKGAAPCYDNIAQGSIRNATRTCIAPTGTIAILMDASSGIEPYFALENTRTMGDGTTFIEKPWTLEETDYRPRVANEINYDWHIKHQAAFQKHTNLAVSKTINMKNNVTPGDIYDAYMMMWKSGCKGGTIYRDGSRENQVLKTVVDEPQTVVQNGWRDAFPHERPSITHKFEVGGVEGYLHVSTYEDGQPGEIFLDIARQGSTLDGVMDWMAQITSVAFQLAHRHDIPFTVFTNKWVGRKFEPSGMTTNNLIPKADSIADYLGQYLNMKFAGTDYLPVQSETRGETCPDCGGMLVHEEGCAHCKACGFERC